MKTPQPESSPSMPWARFAKVMSSKQWAPPGEVMYENEGRYRNATADSLLRLLPTLTDKAAIKQTYRDLNVLFMKELPVIPLMYRPWLFYQFSTRHWTNFPTEENPYAPPQCLMVGAGIKALWGIKPKGMTKSRGSGQVSKSRRSRDRCRNAGNEKGIQRLRFAGAEHSTIPVFHHSRQEHSP
jgi:hypothetical protein